MPYIEKDLRKKVDPFIDELIFATVGYEKSVSPGLLNYIMTRLVLECGPGRKLSYKELAMLIGVLETMKLEFYRRIGVPYEDKKSELNGDVY